MKKQQQFYTIATSVVILSAITVGVSAPPPPDVPFDGGLSLLIGGGMLVTIKKIFFK